MLIIRLLVIYVLLIIRTFSCHDKSIDPPPINSIDTTSHNIIWELDTLGIYPSFIRDVAVINENNIWAVGEIHTPETDKSDSLGHWIPPFNSAYWNGSEWNYSYIPDRGITGSITNADITAIFAFNSNDVWFLSGAGSYVYWNGNVWESKYITEAGGRLQRIWGTSSSNIYFAGKDGYLMHYDGSNWTRLETGTEIDLLDIWGAPDGSVVWACGFTDYLGTILLKIEDKQVTTSYFDNDNRFNIRQDSLSGVLTSIWTDDGHSLFTIASAGLYSANRSTNGEAERIWFDNNFSPGFPWRIRGTAKNDILITGDFTFIAHYNGLTVHPFYELTGRVRTWAISLKGNLFCCAGVDFESVRAVILRGKRLK